MLAIAPHKCGAIFLSAIIALMFAGGVELYFLR